MTLTSDEIQTITMEFLRGDSPTITGEEADELREGLKKDMEIAKKNNWTIELPFEIPEFDNDTETKKNEGKQYRYWSEQTDESPFYIIYREKDGKVQRLDLEKLGWIDEQ